MEQYLTWTKGIFDSSYQVFADGRIKSTLFFNTWRNEARAIDPEKNYFFRTNGFFNATTQILNDKNEVIGSIVYNAWRTNAVLNMINGEQYAWQYTNNWHSKWAISNLKDKQINYTSTTSSGTIITDTDDELLLLTGLFIREYYSRIFIVVLLILLIPIISSNAF